MLQVDYIGILHLDCTVCISHFAFYISSVTCYMLHFRFHFILIYTVSMLNNYITLDYAFNQNKTYTHVYMLKFYNRITYTYVFTFSITFKFAFTCISTCKLIHVDLHLHLQLPMKYFNVTLYDVEIALIFQLGSL